MLQGPTSPLKMPHVSTLATPSLNRDHHRPKIETLRSYTRQGIDGDDARDKHGADQALADQILMLLNFHYPNHLWRVEVSHKQQVATIRLMSFSDVPSVIHLADLRAANFSKTVKDAGGEFLDRYRMPRSGFNISDFNAAVRKFKPHLTRRKHPDKIGAT
jgi:hypothetical protein